MAQKAMFEALDSESTTLQQKATGDDTGAAGGGGMAEASDSDEISNDYDVCDPDTSPPEEAVDVAGVAEIGAEIPNPIPNVDATLTLPLADTLAAARVSFASILTPAPAPHKRRHLHLEVALHSPSLLT